MAGKTLRLIQCCSMREGRLVLHLASSPGGATCVKLGFDLEGSPLETFRDMFPGSRLVLSEEWNRPLIEALQRVLDGKPPATPPRMDIFLTPFQRETLCQITHIPPGATRTYAQVAAAVGNPRSARAIGQALKRNPLPLIFP